MRRMAGPVIAGRVRTAVDELRKARARLRQDRDDPGALHAYRKQARRMWAAVQLAEPYLTPLQYTRAILLAAPLADGLGRLRDEDVLAKRLKAVGRGKSKALQEALDKALVRLPPRKRRKRIERALALAKPKRLAGPLETILKRARKGWLDPLTLVRARLAGRSFAISANSSVEALHSLRLELKAYRYAVEALGREASRLDKQAAAQADLAAVLLGRVMDARVLAALAAKSPPRVAKTLRAAAGKEDAAARREFGQAWGVRWPALQAVS